MLIGAEFDRQPSYSSGTTFALPAGLRPQGHHRAAVPVPAAGPAAMGRRVRRVSSTSPPSWARPASTGFLLSTGWGTWGFKAIPAAGEQLAELIATGTHAGADRAVRARPLRPGGRDGRPQLGGDPLMLWLTCPNCGPRPVEEFRFGGELPDVPDASPTRPSATSTTSGCSTTSTGPRPSAGSTKPAAAAGTPSAGTPARTSSCRPADLPDRLRRPALTRCPPFESRITALERGMRRHRRRSTGSPYCRRTAPITRRTRRPRIGWPRTRGSRRSCRPRPGRG